VQALKSPFIEPNSTDASMNRCLKNIFPISLIVAISFSIFLSGCDMGTYNKRMNESNGGAPKSVDPANAAEEG
jgi:hypothetical protein